MTRLTREDAPAIALIVLAVVLRVRFFAFYDVPNSDFFDFADTATRIWNGELPTSYQRPPLYAIIMGGLARLIPTSDPLLAAGLAANIALFAITLLAIYVVARRFVGHAAFVVVLLVALDPNVVEVNLQPLAQTLTVALAAVAMLAAPARPNVAWACAAFAAIARYEGGALFPALFIRDLLAGRPLRATVLRGALATVPLLGWIALNYRATGHLNPYFDSFSDTAAAGFGFFPPLVNILLGVITPPVTRFVPAAIVVPAVLALMAIGFVAMVRRARADAAAIIVFFAITLAMNLVFFFIAREHVVIFSWICHLALVAGVVAVAGWARKRFQQPATTTDSAPAAPRSAHQIVPVVVLALVLAAGAWSIRDEGIVNVVTFAATTLVIAWFCISRLPRGWPARALVLSAALLVSGAFARQNLHAVDRMLEPQRHVKGALRRLGEWVRDSTAAGARIAMPEPWVAAYYAGSDTTSRFVETRSFEADTPAEFLAECRRRGIDYVVWDSDNAWSAGDFYHTRYRLDLIEPLREGRSTDGFELVYTARAGHGFAYVYRVLP